MVSDNEEVLNWKEDFGRKYQDLPVNEGDAGDTGFIPGSGRSPGGGMETHSSILAGKIPWTEEPDKLQPMGFQSHTTEHACTRILHPILINDKMCMRLR